MMLKMMMDSLLRKEIEKNLKMSHKIPMMVQTEDLNSKGKINLMKRITKCETIKSTN